MLLLDADLQSTLQLPIPCYTSTSHIIDNHYLSHHPLVPFLLYTTGTSRSGQRAGASREISDIATQSATQFQSPTLQAASGHSSSLHISPSISLYNSSLLTSFLQQITLRDKIPSSAKMRKANCTRGTSTSHLRPSRPSRRRMPALATHISAPNLLFAPTTSISTDLRSGSKLHSRFEASG